MTPTEALTAALAEGLLCIGATDGTNEIAEGMAVHLFAALAPEARDKMLLGFAAAELEKTLPEGWVYSLNRVGSGHSLQSWPNGLRGVSDGPDGKSVSTGVHPTPLTAIEAALRELRDE